MDSSMTQCKVSLQKLSKVDLRQRLNYIRTSVQNETSEIIVPEKLVAQMPVTDTPFKPPSITEDQLLNMDDRSVKSLCSKDEEALLNNDNFTSLQDVEDNSMDDELDYEEDPEQADNISLGGFASEFDEIEDEGQKESNSVISKHADQDVENSQKDNIISSVTKVKDWQEKSVEKIVPPLIVTKSNNYGQFAGHQRNNFNQNRLRGPLSLQPVRPRFTHQAFNLPGGQIERQIKNNNTAPRGHCFQYWNKGTCNNNGCRYRHVNNALLKNPTEAFLKPDWQEVAPIQNHNYLNPPCPPHPSPSLLQTISWNSNVVSTLSDEAKIEFLNEIKMADSLKLLKNLKNLDIERAWLAINHLKDIHQKLIVQKLDVLYLQVLEEFILQIRYNVNLCSAQIAENILEVKKTLLALKWKDFLWTADIQAKLGNYDRAVGKLKDMYVLFKHMDWQEISGVVLNCIHCNGVVLRIWDDIKNDLMKERNDRILQPLLTQINFDVLKARLKHEDLLHLYKKVLDPSFSLHEDAKKVFLRLLTPTASLPQLLHILNRWPTLATLSTLEKILYEVNHVGVTEFRFAVNVFNRVPAAIFCEATDSLNKLLVNTLKKDTSFSPVVEDLHEIMRNTKVKLSQESALGILKHLCDSKCYDLFLQTCKEMEQWEWFQSDFHVPEWFSRMLFDILNNSSGYDVAVAHTMIQLMLKSNVEPPDSKLSEVISMLINQRRYLELHDLVEKCFKSGIVLSQMELRRVVHALELWSSNVEASIAIYAKMRRKYPRAEQRCTCGGGGDLHGKLLRSVSNPFDYNSNYIHHSQDDNTIMEIESDQGDDVDRIVTYDEDEAEEDEEMSLLKLSAELNQCADDLCNFKELYLKSVEEKAGNSDEILNGLFLGISGTAEPNSYYENFVTSLVEHFNPESNTDVELPEDIGLAVGRLGLRLINFLSNDGKYPEAYDILSVFHSQSIQYLFCGEPFGTMMQTKEPMSLCRIACVCTKVCVRNNMLKSAYHVFKYCKYGDDEQRTEDEESTRNIVASELITGLVQESYVEEAWEIFLHSNETMNEENKAKLVNLIGCGACDKKSTLKDAIYTFMMQNQVEMHKRTLKKYVKNITDLSEGINLFQEGLKIGVYEKTYSNRDKFSITIKSPSSAFEIQMVFEQHMSDLITDRTYDYPSLVKCTGPRIDELHPFKLPIIPDDEGDLSQIETTTRLIHAYLTEQAKPPLCIIFKKKQLFQISHDSVAKWVESNSEHITSLKEKTEKYVFVLNCNEPLKKKRKIRHTNGFDMQMTICPTPRPFRELSPPPMEKMAIHTNSHSTRKVIKSLPDTDDTEVVKNSIRKIVCTKLTAVSRNHKLSLEKFQSIAKNLSKNYINTHPCNAYNKIICLEVEDFVGKNFSQFL